jgi:hypothetical protein
LGINPGDIALEPDTSVLLERVRYLDDKFFDIYGEIVDSKFINDSVIRLLKDALDTAEDLILSDKSLYLAQYLLIYSEDILASLDMWRGINISIVGSSVRFSSDAQWFRLWYGNLTVLLGRSYPDIYVYSGEALLFHIHPVNLVVFRDLDGDDFLDDDELIDTRYLGNASWSIELIGSPLSPTILYSYRSSVFNVSLGLGLYAPKPGITRTLGMVPRDGFSVAVNMSDIFGGGRDTKLGLVFLVSTSSERFQYGVLDGVGYRSLYVHGLEPGYSLIQVQGRYGYIDEGSTVKSVLHVGRLVCCGRTLEVHSVFDYTYAGTVSYTYLYYIGYGHEAANPSALEYFILYLLFISVIMAVALSLYLYYRGFPRPHRYFRRFSPMYIPNVFREFHH